MTAIDRLRFGWIADQRLGWADLLRATQQVERLGYDSLWLSDHLAAEDGGWLLDPWTSLAALLASVPRLEVGTLVLANGLRAPLLTVQMTHTVADIGPGRFVLGLGAGGSRKEHDWCGIAFPKLPERLSALKSACRLVRLANESFRPEPVTGQPPTVPLLIGGTSHGILRIAARWADRWTIWGNPDQLRAHGDVLSGFARSAGRQPTDIRRGAIVMLLPDHLPQHSDPAKWPAVLTGNATAVAGQLHRYAAAGVTDIVICDYGLLPADRPAALAWFADVLTRLRSGASA